MTRLSNRYALAVGLVIALFLAAISYGRSLPVRDECPSNEVLLDARTLDPRIEVLTEGRPKTKITDGRLVGKLPATDPERYAMLLTINRTFGLPNRILQPALTLPGKREPDEVEISVRDTPEGALPVHTAYERRSSRVRATSYFMTYRREAIRSPLWTRIRSGLSSIDGGSWPITLFAISSVGHPSQLEDNRARMEAWLLEAWAHYRSVCKA